MPQGTSPATTGHDAPATSGVKEQRVTKQRLAVSAALDELDDFVSTQELYRLLQNKGISVSLATAYRILQSLADDGLIDVLRNGDGEASIVVVQSPGTTTTCFAATAARQKKWKHPPSKPGLPARQLNMASPR